MLEETIKHIPFVKVDNVYDTKLNEIILFLEDYIDLRFQKINLETVHKMIFIMRALHIYGVSVIPYFSCVFVAQAKPEYVGEIGVEYTRHSNILLSIPIEILDIIEASLDKHVLTYGVNIAFDPFSIDWNSAETYRRILEFFDFQDARYNYMITVLWVKNIK